MKKEKVVIALHLGKMILLGKTKNVEVEFRVYDLINPHETIEEDEIGKYIVTKHPAK